MKLFFQLASLISFTSLLSVAGSWSGALVDAHCYATPSHNTRDATPPGSQDVGRHIEACAPTSRTKSFAIVQQDGTTVNLDAQGNQKAKDLVTKTGKMSRYDVNVTGDMDANTIKVDTISAAK